MKISISNAPGGGIKREIDFQGAVMPNGLPIQKVLDENVQLKSQVENLKSEVKDSAKIITINPNRKITLIV